MKLSREVKTAIFAIGAILLFIFGYSYLKGTNILESSRTFYAKYKNVEGLAKSAPVTINGLTVGKVTNISFENKKGGLVVEFSVENDFEFSKGSQARIYSSNPIGGKSLGIFPIYQGPKATSGDTLKGQIEKGILDAFTDKLGPLELKVESTLSTLDTLLLSVTDLIDEKTRMNLKQTMATLNTTSQSFKNISQNMDQLLIANKEKLGSTVDNLSITSKNFAALSDSLANINTGKMVQQIEGVTQRLNNIMESIDNEEGSVGKLLKDEKLYDNMESASKQLDLLLEDMRLNPKRYVHFSLFGKRAKEYEQPEETKQ